MKNEKAQYDPVTENLLRRAATGLRSGPEPLPDDAPGTARRRAILREIEGAVCRDRQNTYGDAEDNFETIAELWNVYASRRGLIASLGSDGLYFSAADVAVMSGLIKVARLAASPGHLDNWIDAAGYFVCGGGITKASQEKGL